MSGRRARTIIGGHATNPPISTVHRASQEVGDKPTLAQCQSLVPLDRDITLDAPEETRLYVEFEDRATVGADNDGMIFPYRLETEIVVDAAVAECNFAA